MRIILLIFAILVSNQLKSQTLAFEHLYKNEHFYMKPGCRFLLQTQDDPVGYTSQVQYINFENDTFLLCNTHSQKEVFKVPLKHIACIYIAVPLRTINKAVFLIAGLTLSISAFALLAESPAAFAMNAAGIPLCVAALNYSYYKRYYIPSFDVYEK